MYERSIVLYASPKSTQRPSRVTTRRTPSCGAAWATHYLGIGRWQLAEPEQVKELMLEALRAFEELKEPVGILRSLWWLVRVRGRVHHDVDGLPGPRLTLKAP